MFTQSAREQFVIDRTLYKHFCITIITWATAGVKGGTLSLTRATTRMCIRPFAHMRSIFLITWTAPSHTFTLFSTLIGRNLFYTYFVGEDILHEFTISDILYFFLFFLI